MRIGYIRVSTEEQNLDAQRAALAKAGCEKIFEDQLSGKNKDDRSGLLLALDTIKKGDTLVVWKTDRLSRKLKDILEMIDFLKDRGVTFLSITEDVDTTTATKELAFHVQASVAQWERRIIGERTKDALAARKARGVKLGPPRTINDAKIQAMRHMRASGHGYGAIAKAHNVSKDSAKRLTKDPSL